MLSRRGAGEGYYVAGGASRWSPTDGSVAGYPGLPLWQRRVMSSRSDELNLWRCGAESLPDMEPDHQPVNVLGLSYHCNQTADDTG
jgi:hypothetical protein